jgi:L-amino acid N-acyltransferase YncA
MPGFLIRPATPADIPAITAIYGHYVLTNTATFELDPPDETEMAARMAGVHTSNLPYLVAQSEEEPNGQLVGYAYAHLFHARPGYRFTIEDSVYIDHAFTGRGIGTLLLGALLDRCRATGARQMIAAIGGDNPASIKLHAAHGFEHAGVLRSVGYKFDRWLDVTYMQRAL